MKQNEEQKEDVRDLPPVSAVDGASLLAATDTSLRTRT